MKQENLNAMQWVQKAVSVKDVRYWLKNVHAEAGKLRGTDGTRIHIAPFGGDDGFYDKEGNQCLIDGKFPSIAQVIPKDVGRTPVDLSLEYPQHVGTIITTTILRVGNDQQEPFHINTKFLKDAMSNMSPIVFASISSAKDKFLSLKIEFADNSLAVIMVVKI